MLVCACVVMCVCIIATPASWTGRCPSPKHRAADIQLLGELDTPNMECLSIMDVVVVVAEIEK